MHARPHDPPEGGPGASQEARLVRRFLALVKMRYAERQTPETETEAFVKGHGLIKKLHGNPRRLMTPCVTILSLNRESHSTVI
jgi:hypothetical protein